MIRLVAMAKSAVRCRDSIGPHSFSQLVHQLWPCLTSLLCKGGARLKDVLRRLDAHAIRACICAEDLDGEEVGQEPTMTSQQPEDDNLLFAMVGWCVISPSSSVVTQAVLPEGIEAAPYNGSGFGVKYQLAHFLLHPTCLNNGQP